jgi:FkbM family methyltransferase
MINFVPVEELVDQSVLSKILSLNFSDYVVESEIRGITIKWLCLSKRLLWMAVGHEYIEPELLDWIDSISPHSNFWDVGSSNGIFAVYAGLKGLDCLAIEPDPLNYFLLTYNNYLNGSPIKTLNMAVSNLNGVSTLNMKKFELGGHLKVLNKTSEVLGEQFTPEYIATVPTITLDQIASLFKITPTHIKIDVDGSEEAVICGGQKVLADTQQVFIELTDNFINSDQIQLLQQLDLILTAKSQVQNYEGLYNCIFTRVKKSHE